MNYPPLSPVLKNESNSGPDMKVIQFKCKREFRVTVFQFDLYNYKIREKKLVLSTNFKHSLILQASILYLSFR